MLGLFMFVAFARLGQGVIPGLLSYLNLHGVIPGWFVQILAKELFQATV